jgi:hypothetical protein
MTAMERIALTIDIQPVVCGLKYWVPHRRCQEVAAGNLARPAGFPFVGSKLINIAILIRPFISALCRLAHATVLTAFY